jgi:1-acyl-sn-glycerol-3-phosphate acyltransferase
METALRALKGLGMAFMFFSFAVGILVFLVFIIPFSCLLNRLVSEGSRVERAARRGFGWWLGFMGVLGLVRDRPSRGRPLDGPCVVVANHPGLFDVLFLIRDIQALSVMVKSSLTRFLPLGPVLKALHYVQVPDFDRINPMDTAEAAIEKLRAGRKLLLFPEGTRSPRGGLRSFRAGAFKIARMTGAPIQPVLIRNHPPFLCKEDQWYFPPLKTSALEMEYWEPLDPPEKGGERVFAKALETRYRNALGIETNLS